MHSCFLPRYVLSELVETEKMYVEDLGQIVEVTPFSLPSPGLTPSVCPGLILRDILDAPLSHLPSPLSILDLLGRGRSH